jgi:hypothetical protein
MTKNFEFMYDGKKRYVVDALYEEEYNTIVGLEETKAGKSSNQIKRYSIEKIINQKELND